MPILFHGILATEELHSDVNPVHTYMEGGSFDVVLTVSDVAGATNQMKISVTVMAPEFIEHSGNITSDETWIEGVHVITGDVHVDGAILTIEARGHHQI